MAKIGLLATLDTKSAETGYVAELLRDLGHRPVIVDCGIKGEARIEPDIDRASVVRSGGTRIDPSSDAAGALTTMGANLGVLVRRLRVEGRASAFIALGGGKGTNIAGEAMRALALDVPRVIVSCARPDMIGDIVREHRIVVVPSSGDISGLSAITKSALRAGVHAIDGLIQAASIVDPRAVGGTVAISSFGTTTPAVQKIREALEAGGQEVWVFPATGAGGRAMEAYIADRKIDRVIDLTIAELTNHMLGGMTSAGPARLEAAGAAGIPQVVVPGAVDFLNFADLKSVPEAFAAKSIYRHTPYTSLVRTSAEENERLGRLVGKKLACACGPVAVVVPLRGFSVYDSAGGPFWDPEANAAWLNGLQSAAPADMPVYLEERHINEPAFAEKVTEVLGTICET